MYLTHTAFKCFSLLNLKKRKNPLLKFMKDQGGTSYVVTLNFYKRKSFWLLRNNIN